jgi:hypothetical protein
MQIFLSFFFGKKKPLPMTGVTDRGYQPLSGGLVCSQRASSLGCILLSLSISVKRAEEVAPKLTRTGLLRQRAARNDEKEGVIDIPGFCPASMKIFEKQYNINISAFEITNGKEQLAVPLGEIESR